MKKVLSFVLVLSMILGSFGMAFAAPADVVGKDYEDAVNVLVELGVVAGYEDGTYRPANVVTRAEMATFIVKAMGLADYAAGKSEFTDMAGHWADPFVAYAVSMGFVKGNTDGTFAPDATVSYDQAITMVVQALGYKGEYLTGGYPGAFVNQAKTLGLLDGIKVGAVGANRGDIATLLFNTLDEAFVRYSTDGVLQVVALGYTNEGAAIPDTMMDRLGASAYAATNADVYAEGYFVVTGKEDSVIDLKEYQGALVKAYQNSKEEIIAMKEVKSVFLKGDLDMTELTFTVDGTEYKMDRVTTAGIEHFVNGAHQASTTDAVTVGDAEGVVIAAKLSGKYVDEIYSIAEWNGETPVMWDADYAEILAEDFAIEDATFAATDNDEIDTDTFALVGAESLDKIPEDAIVTYYVGEVDGEDAIVKVEVSTTVVEGKITKVKNDKFTINGKVYERATLRVDSSADSLDVTDEGKFYLDAAGKIAYFDGTTKVEDYAIVTYDMKTVDGAYSEDGVIKVKMMTADGKEAIYVVDDAEEVKETDGTTSTAAVSKGAVVAYKLNKDGEISKMVKQTTSEAVKLTAKGYLDGVKVAADVAVFEIEADGDIVKAELADVPVNADLGESIKVVDATSGEVVVIVLAGEYGEDEDAVFAVLVDYGLVADPDDETAKVYEVEMLVDGVAKTYLTTDSAVQGFTTDGALFELEFSGSEIAAFAATDAAVGNDGNVTLYAVTADGNVQAEKNGEVYEVADDVVVYLYDAETDSVSLSSLKKISKGDTIKLYELDGDDDKDGHDVIIYVEN